MMNETENPTLRDPKSLETSDNLLEHNL